ncbi:MAG: hypothetical protein DRN27_02675 [Thermoplasmata archaeon]|nr:MAG: hypothetical protein DRN27_02675 [Thermoplasmata archaeon]
MICIVIIGSLSIIFGINGLLRYSSIIMPILGITFGIISWIFSYIGFSRELIVFEDRIVIPTEFRRKFIPLSEIIEIRLNTSSKEDNNEIDICLENGEIEHLSKNKIKAWEEFKNVLINELKSKIIVKL